MATEVNAAAETSAAQPVTALHVGDLDVGVTEEELRPAKAIEVLNFTPLNGKRIRITYSNRDDCLRKSGAGNIFVKNLDEKIDHKALYEIFSSFGDIISSKVQYDAFGQSKGYGFVHYTSEEAAKKAIEELNGVRLHEKEVFVGPFMSKQEREKAAKFTNVFVKNLSEMTNEENLRTAFGEFGFITSVVVIRDKDGNSKCFGFVNFENAEDAAKSVEVLNGQTIDDKEWYVGKAQKKSEREQMLKIQHEQLTKVAMENSLGLNNLYLKNLDENIDDDKLKELFSPFGAITSCKVMRDPRGISKGSGFVAFSTRQEASKAITEMNGKMAGSKPLYVAVAEKKEARQTRLQALYTNTRPNTIVPPVTPRMLMYTGQQFLYAQTPPPILTPMPTFQYQRPFVPGTRPTGTTLPNSFFPMVQQHSQSPVPMLHQQVIFRGNPNRFPPGYGFPSVTARNTIGGMPSVPRESVPSPLHDQRVHRSVPIGALASALANASPAEQTMMLGESLYPLVEKLEPEMAAKVTGMLLEMDQTEVLNLLECPLSLRAKVIEAMHVLRNAPQEQPNSPSEHLASLVLNE
ncbi:hypothetical protein BUALT_Bualt19G0108100 [Buddleja alternifolia]|uniref:Polyadenylate-binding protein n=1 Tax=Buddleja alternifolia TaxID=168488 RepID=A0AAV6WBA7_9LAMI|nr:hypothetical protein BUALT_Bualt19G0108100 [Buddleja alternifolia]